MRFCHFQLTTQSDRRHYKASYETNQQYRGRPSNIDMEQIQGVAPTYKAARNDIHQEDSKGKTAKSYQLDTNKEKQERKHKHGRSIHNVVAHTNHVAIQGTDIQHEDSRRKNAQSSKHTLSWSGANEQRPGGKHVFNNGQVENHRQQKHHIDGFKGQGRFTLDTNLDHGTKIKVYKANITSVPVDVIVNAANERLDHIGGVAYAIAKAAGHRFEEESHKYVAKNGEIPISQVAITGAGNLRHTYVIHAVGPMWEGEAKKDKIQYLLERTFLNAFQCANGKRLKSLATPPISSGI